MGAQLTGEAVLSRFAVPGPISSSKRAERALAKAAQSGSPDAIEQLIRNHWSSSFRLALGVLGDRALAEDCAQEGLLSAIRRLDAFDSKRPFAPWLHRIVLNQAIDMRRRRARRPEVALADAIPTEPRSLVEHDLVSALDLLDERSRAVVVLRHVLGYRAGEIALLVDTSEGNVRSILSRSLTTLRNSLTEEEVHSDD